MTDRRRDLAAATSSGWASPPGRRRSSRPAAGTAARSLEPKLRAFSRLNDWVGEKILLSRSRLAPEYPPSARTAERRFPAYSITWNRRRVYPEPSRPTGIWRWAGWSARPSASRWRCWRGSRG